MTDPFISSSSVCRIPTRRGWTTIKVTVLVRPVAKWFVPGLTTATKGDQWLVGGKRVGISQPVEKREGPLHDQGPILSTANNRIAHEPLPIPTIQDGWKPLLVQGQFMTVSIRWRSRRG